MPNPVIGIMGASVGGSVLSASAQRKAASQASAAQVEAADKSIEEQRRQFAEVQRLLAPYVGAGTTALSQQMALIGSSGADAQQAAINAIQAGPEFGALTSAGEEAILAQGAATGGLRGGNVQAALAKFRPEILSGLINQQYSRLGGLTEIGANAAAGQASAGTTLGTNIGNLYGQIGASQAGAAMARGNATANMFGNITGAYGGGLGLFAGLKQEELIPADAGFFGKWKF